MNEQQYMQEVLRTYAGPDHPTRQLTLGALGLAGECGEVVDLIKKHLYQGHLITRDVLCDELGDVLWYLMILMNASHLTLSEVMEHNVKKLRKRYPNGFESERS